MFPEYLTVSAFPGHLAVSVHLFLPLSLSLVSFKTVSATYTAIIVIATYIAMNFERFTLIIAGYTTIIAIATSSAIIITET